MMGVVVVNDATKKRVETEYKSRKPIVMLHHMNGCGHCQMLKPIWDTCVSKYQGPGMIAEVEISQQDNLIPEMRGVMGFPTIIMYKDGTKVEFNNQRSEANISQFINRYLSPSTPHPHPRPKSAPKPKTPRAKAATATGGASPKKAASPKKKKKAT